MPFDNFGNYNPQHKTWDHVGNMVPNIEHSEGIRPAGEFKPAAWLPVQYFDKHFEEFFVVMPGKILAFDNQNRVVPAQYGLSGASITYTAQDVEAGVIDVRTGAPLLSGAIGTFAVSGVTDFMGTGEAMAVSKPVGIAPYAYFQWGGDGSSLDDGFNPAAFRKHNHNLQHQVAILCDYVIELPLVPAQTSAEVMNEASNADNVSTFDPLANLPVASNTVRTPITFADGASTSDVDTRFVNQVDSVAEITQAGDWHIDLETGVISVWASASLGAADDYTVTYSNYASAPTGTSVSKFASALGDLQPGDFVVCNADSNWIKASSQDFTEVMGQVLEVENVADKDALGKVRTAFNPPIDTDAPVAEPGI